MRNNATEMDSLSSGEKELKDKIVELSKQLEEAEKLKKSAMKKFNDDIKDIKAEIKMTLELMQKMKEDSDG